MENQIRKELDALYREEIKDLKFIIETENPKPRKAEKTKKEKAVYHFEKSILTSEETLKLMYDRRIGEFKKSLQK
jgi:hypothetical protein